MFLKCILLILSLLYLGCEEPENHCELKEQYNTFNVYIDSAWQGIERDMLYEAVDRVNDMGMDLMCRPFMEIVGEVEVDHTTISIDDSLDTFAIYYDEPKWLAESHYVDLLGVSAFYKNIRLFKFEIPNANQNYTLAVIMHELLHYLGVKKHSDDPDAVMYHAVSPLSTSYTEADRDLLCEIWSC